MNYYALLYDLVDDMVTRRVPFREQHLRLAREARERGELVLAGALSEPVDRALLVFHVADKGKVEDFARRDPYVVNGLAKKWEVRPWNVVVGNEEPAASAPSASKAILPGAILRRWSARTTEALLPKYLAYFSENVLPELRRVNGYLAATVSTHHTATEAEILVETTLRSLNSIRNFAGPDLEAAVVHPQAAALLTDFDRRARHFDLALSDGAHEFQVPEEDEEALAAIDRGIESGDEGRVVPLEKVRQEMKKRFTKSTSPKTR